VVRDRDGRPPRGPPGGEGAALNFDDSSIAYLKMTYTAT